MTSNANHQIGRHDPTRLIVLKKLCAAIEEVNPGNGYDSDLDGRCYRGRIVFGAKDPLPMISILEVPIPLDQIAGPNDNPAQAGPWELVVQGFVEDDHENPTDPAHLLLAEVKKRLVQEKRRLREDAAFDIGNVVIGIGIGPGVVRPPDDVSDKAYFWLTITLTIVEDMDDPYWTGD